MVLLGYEDLVDAAAAMEALGANHELVGRRQMLLDDPVMVVTRDGGLVGVHVLAEEMAFVAPEVHGVDLVGSDDATTCSIVLLISVDIVAVAHLDSEEQISFFLDKWESLVSSEPTRVAVVGGYDDERGIARPIAMEILQSFMSSEKVYDMQQFVTGRWNTTESDNGVMMPRARGIGYFPAEDAFRRVEFEVDARLPLIPLRFAGVSPHPLHTLLCCVENEKPLEVTVGPYWGTLVSPDICPYMLDLDDDELLPRISTSPFAEGPKFLQDMRDMLEFISNCSRRTLGNTLVLTLPPRNQTGGMKTALLSTRAVGAVTMESSFVANPYVEASAPSSRKIREILDREDASYEAWRKTRKPVRLPHASLKLNRPLTMQIDYRHDSNQSKPTKSIETTFRSSEAGSAASSDVVGQRYRSHSLASSTVVAPNKLVKRKDALIAGRFTQSAERFPILVCQRDARQKQVQFNEVSDPANKPSDGGTVPSIMPRKATRRKFRPYMYDFHSRQVFSFAKSEAEEFDDALKRENCEKLLTKSDTENKEFSENIDSKSSFSDRWSNTSEDYSRQELHQRHSEYLLSGLGFLSGADYNATFDIHWTLSEAEKIVRDAVDRKRIREILRKAYRMLLWFFRFYAGNAAYAIASERRTGTGTMAALGEGLFEIPSRARLLEDLNVQYVDAARFGVTDTPLKRESLIDFLINVARMMCTHPSNPNRLKMVINDGIEMSEAVKTLVYEHFGVFAQIQDVDHFRTLFLCKPEALANMDKFSVGGPRRLDAVLENHKNNLANFFDELVSTGITMRSDGGTDKTKPEQRQRGNGVVCTQFLITLRAISLIMTRRTTPIATTNTDADGDALGGGPTGIDEVRAVRIFLSCLPLAIIDHNESESASITNTTTVSTNTTSTESRELTLSQFIEALLRVAFTWKELQICHGRFDVCPNQMISDPCRCTIDPANYAYNVFDDAAEEIFTRIHTHRLKLVKHRTSMRMKSMNIKSHLSLHSLVATTVMHRAPTRLPPVDGMAANNDAGA